MSVAAWIACAFSFIGGMIFQANPIQRFIQQTFNLIFPNAIPGPEDLVIMRWRGLISREEYEHYMERWGFKKDWADKFYTQARRVLNISELIFLWRLGEIDEETLEKEAANLQIPKTQLDWYKKVTAWYPTPRDLVTFAVRDVWREDTVKKFGYDEEFPEEFANWAKKFGMSEYWAKIFWRAHWELPSLTLGFEAFHRLHPDYETETPVTEDDIKDLMRLHDVLPYWRDRLLKLSYNLVTRVDARRLYLAGIWDDDKLYVHYRKLGYTPEDAEAMVKWAKLEKAGEPRELTKSEIKKAYLEGEISEDQAREFLKALDYPEEIADILIDLWKRELKEKWIKKYIKLYMKAYVNDMITKDEFLDVLSKLELSSLQIDAIMHEAEIERANKLLDEMIKEKEKAG